MLDLGFSLNIYNLIKMFKMKMKVILEFSQYPDPGVNAKDRFVCGGDRIRRRSIPPPPLCLSLPRTLSAFSLSHYNFPLSRSRDSRRAASSAPFVCGVRVLSFIRRPRLDRHPGLA